MYSTSLLISVHMAEILTAVMIISNWDKLSGMLIIQYKMHEPVTFWLYRSQDNA
jgi:hypothetical protein